MSADWQPQAPETWKVSLACTRAEGEAIALAEPDLGVDPPPVLMTSEPDPARPDAWRLDAYCEQRPDAALIARIAALAPSSGAAPEVERIADANWVTLSQRFLEPIRAGRFLVHTAAHAGVAAPDTIAFQIEAGRAFGTGHHETTAGCLRALDALQREGRRFRRIADVGTGSGLLAFAARALWPDAAVLATDIDPVAIEVARVNMDANGIDPGAIALLVADGAGNPAMRAHAPFHLIVANILAGPLIALAADLVALLDAGGVIVLAGLLASQAEDVLGAYRSTGMASLARSDEGDWSILTLVQPA